jgi:hypothetical protein
VLHRCLGESLKSLVHIVFFRFQVTGYLSRGVTIEPSEYCLTKALLQSLPGILVMVDGSATKQFNAMRITLMRSLIGAIGFIPAMICERSGGQMAEWRMLCWERSQYVTDQLS